MRLRNRGVLFLTLFGSLMAVSPPVVMAQDFAAGVVVGTMLADDENEKREAAAKGPQSQTLIDYEQGDTPVITRVEVFPANQWRQVDGAEGGYIICPGEFKDYFEHDCRVPDRGFNGFMGGSREGQALPILKALEQKEGQPVRLRSIEVNGDTLAAKYQYVSTGQPAKGTEQPIAPEEEPEPEQEVDSPENPESVAADAEQREQLPSVSSGDPFESMTYFMLNIMGSTFMKIIAGVMLVVGLIRGIARQSITALFMGIMPAMMIYNAPVVVEAILGVDATATGGTTAQVPGQPDDGGASMLWMILALVIPPIAYSLYCAWQNRRDDELDELLRDYAGRQAGETAGRPRDEPASLDELAQRQRDSEQTSEPVVVSTVSSAPKVKEEEPVELQPGKRKIILD